METFVLVFQQQSSGLIGSDQYILDDFVLAGFPCVRRVVTLQQLAVETVATTYAITKPDIENIEAGTIDDDSQALQGVCTAIASLSPDSHLEVCALASILGRCKKSIQRAVRRGELPQPFTFMGRHVWLAGTIVDHLQKLQDSALRQVERRDRKIEEQKRGH